MGPVLEHRARAAWSRQHVHQRQPLAKVQRSHSSDTGKSTNGGVRALSGADDGVSRVANVFSILGNQRRLLVVGYLSLFDVGATVEVRHLARVVRGIETGTPPRSVGTDSYESAYNGLIQTHLPKLDDRGLIAYDEAGKTVTVESQIEQYVAIVSICRSILLTCSSL